MKIVMLSEQDYAGSGWRMAEAIRRNTDHTMMHIRAVPHKYGYRTDIPLATENLSCITEIIEEADIIHFKGDDLPVRQWHGVRIPDSAKIVLTVGGSKFRRHGEKRSEASMGWHTVEKYVQASNLRTALSPDLNYPEFKAVYTPYVIDSESKPYCWKPRSPMRIGYYPGRGGLKGDRTHILPALNILKKDGFSFDLMQFQNMKHEESVETKKGLTLFIDQISIAGCYGNSGVEAMQFGVPVIAYISQRAMDQSKGTMFQLSPAMNPGPTPAGLVGLLRDILSGKIDLQEISLQTKCYCDEFHGYRANGKLWDGLYESLRS